MKFGFSKQVAHIAAAIFGVSVENICSRYRGPEMVRVRNACYLAVRQVRGHSYPMIGRAFSRDHSTVMHGIDRCKQFMASDPDYAEKVSALLTESNALRLSQAQMPPRNVVDSGLLPARIYASQVCDLGGFSRDTLRNRIAKGTMPRPVDTGREQIFLRDEVLQALKIGQRQEEVAASW